MMMKHKKSMNPFETVGPQRSGFYFLQGYFAHQAFCKWVKDHSIVDVLEYGCGYFEYYSHFFNSLGIKYTGLDISEEIIAYRMKLHPYQFWVCEDFVKYSFYNCIKRSDPPLLQSYDLVFSHMVVAGVLGEERNLRLLKATVEASRKYGYIVIWDMNNVYLDVFKNYLTELGCFNIVIEIVATNINNPVDPTKETILRWEQ